MEEFRGMKLMNGSRKRRTGNKLCISKKMADTTDLEMGQGKLDENKQKTEEFRGLKLMNGSRKRYSLI